MRNFFNNGFRFKIANRLLSGKTIGTVKNKRRVWRGHRKFGPRPSRRRDSMILAAAAIDATKNKETSRNLQPQSHRQINFH